MSSRLVRADRPLRQIAWAGGAHGLADAEVMAADGAQAHDPSTTLLSPTPPGSRADITDPTQQAPIDRKAWHEEVRGSTRGGIGAT